jgi:hypothetical protein
VTPRVVPTLAAAVVVMDVKVGVRLLVSVTKPVLAERVALLITVRLVTGAGGVPWLWSLLASEDDVPSVVVRPKVVAGEVGEKLGT